MFFDAKLFINFDRALKFFDDYSKYHNHLRDDLIFLVPIIEARRICEGKNPDHGELLGTYKGVPIMCEQYSFQGLWVRNHDNEYCKVTDFDSTSEDKGTNGDISDGFDLCQECYYDFKHSYLKYFEMVSLEEAKE